MLKDLVLKNRSYRRFYQDEKISRDILISLIDLARRTPSAANLQPLRYYISNEREENEKIFSCLKWAGYLSDWDGPKEGEKPSAYIVVLADKENSAYAPFDTGIVSQTILLAAVEKDFGGCIVGSVNKEKLSDLFHFPRNLEIMLVIALGKPKEKVVLEEVKNENIEYWRDENQVHHVPKRKLREVILNFGKK